MEKKVKVACVGCRKRKSKCDGLSPCSNCVHSNRTCEFPQITEKRRRGKGKSNSKEQISLLNKRIALIEGLITNLSGPQNPLLTPSTTNSPTATRNSSMDSSSQVSNERDFSSQVTNDRDFSSQITNANQTFKKDFSTEPSEATASDSHYSQESDDSLSPTSTPQPFGCHSIYSFFSKPSMNWLQHKFKNEKILNSFKTIPFLYRSMLESCNKAWLDPPLKNVILKNDNFGFFPSNELLVMEIIDCYYNSFSLLTIIMKREELIDLFRLYYKSDESKHRFKYSELITMNTALAICLSNRFSNDEELRSKYSVLSNFSNEKIYEMKNSFFSNALCYFDRVKCSSEGLPTIKALSLMIMYVESSFASDVQLETMLCSLLVRYAQDLGIHNAFIVENNFPESQRETCRRLWYFCEVIDIQVSYKTGRSPMISDDNICTNSETDTNSLLRVHRDLFDSPDDISHLDQEILTKSKDDDAKLIFYFNFHILILMRIKRKSYNNLFSFEAQKKNNKNLFYEKLDTLNLDLKRLLDLQDPCMKCLDSNEVFPSLPQTFIKKPCLCDGNLRKMVSNSNSAAFAHIFLNCSILSHAIIINRSPIFQAIERDERFYLHIELAGHCARLTLRLISECSFVSRASKAMLSWNNLHPFIAFVVLLGSCVCSEDVEEVRKDVDLLIDCALNHFCIEKTDAVISVRLSISGDDEIASSNEEKLVFYDIVIRILLKLLLDLVSTKHNIVIQNTQLCRYFKSIRSVFPKLFNSNSFKDPSKVHDFKIMLSSFENFESLDSKKRLEPILSNLINFDGDDIPDCENIQNSWNLPNFFYQPERPV